jgi:hypothetical protein
MNRVKRIVVALLVGVLLASQVGPAAAGLPIRCGEGCVTTSEALRSE